MKVAILSCFYPFRGGIAQFNANLFEELGKKHDVRAFNFSRQYPDILFPGKTQYVTPEDQAVPVKAEALLDTADPFSWSRTAREIRSWGPDLLVVRYWMSWFAPSLGAVARRMAPGCKVVGILDNVIPHERHWFDKPLTRWFLRGLDGAVTLCSEVEADLLELRGDIPHTVLPHPIYTHFGEKLPRGEAERILGLPAGRRTLLFFGLIREYKGLDILLKAFDLLDDRYQLVIAGEPYGSFDKYRKLIEDGRAPQDVHVFPDYIRDSEVKNYFSAADLTVLPYRSATQSGISSVSNHFEVPMVVTGVGGLRETVGERGTGIVCDEGSPACVAAAIRRYFDEPDLQERLLEGIRSEKDRLSWSRFSSGLTAFADNLQS
ncbi:MAG: glycosyltransferase [Bacteroidales bacterium]|nr:glycosyltransferase [Bacteroidales bacterium]